MDSLHLHRLLGRWLLPASLFGAPFAACTSEEGSGPSEREDRAEQSDEHESTTDEDGKKDTASKTDAKAPVASPAKDAGSASAPRGGDAGRPSDKPPLAPAKDGGVRASSAGLPCEVARILSDECGACHGEKPASGAPMALIAQTDFQAAGALDDSKKVYELVRERVNASSKPMPPVGTLAAADLATLNAWLDEGAPASTEICDQNVPAPDANDLDTTGLECYKLVAHAAGDKNAKYSASPGETYINFGFQAPWQGMAYGITVRSVVDNAAVLHHWLLYKEPVQDGSVVATIGQHSNGEMIHGWAPGGIPMDFRRHGDVGFELPDSTYSIEIHYNNSTGGNADDASGVEVCVQREKPANIASLSWLGYDQGGTLSYASGICLVPDTTWTGTCQPISQEPIHIMYVTPHMHEVGTHMKAVINSPNGESRVLHDEPFNFNYQVTYEKDVVLMPGESITTTCSFSEPKCAGQSTTQEMCYLYSYAWPKHALRDNGPEGRFMHGEGVCLGQ